MYSKRSLSNTCQPEYDKALRVSYIGLNNYVIYAYKDLLFKIPAEYGKDNRLLHSLCNQNVYIRTFIDWYLFETQSVRIKQ